MQRLNGRAELIHAAAAAVGAHPWPAVCAADAIAVFDGAAAADAIAWRGGNPWRPQHNTLHVLGAPHPAADLVFDLARPGQHVLTTPDILQVADQRVGTVGTDRYAWNLRTIRAPLPFSRNAPVSWLGHDAGDELTDLLDVALPHAAFRPGDEGTGRWCGVRNRIDGTLVACAAQTLPAAPIAHLSSLAVRPDARRRGLGAAVTSFFVAEAFDAGAPMVVLAVDQDNPLGGALYDRLGFDTWHFIGVTASATPDS